MNTTTAATINIETLLDTEGFISDPETWSEDLARLIARNDGFPELTREHWTVIHALREHYQRFGAAPPAFSHLCNAHQLGKHCVESLFRSEREAWRIAGLPDPGEEAKTYMSPQRTFTAAPHSAAVVMRKQRRRNITMNTPTPSHQTPVIRFEQLNWVATPPLPRDQQQSLRLHEPDHLIGTIDPITGRDIGDVRGHPSIVDGNLTIYFESEETRAKFEQMPVNHPYEHSVGEPSVDIDRGG